MKFLFILPLLTVLVSYATAKAPSKTASTSASTSLNNDYEMKANVRIYSNLAEIIQPLGKLPVEFSSEEWSHIRSDTITLVGPNVNVTQQTITEKKKSLNNHDIYIRSPVSTDKTKKLVKAIMIDENRNLVKLIAKDISKDPIFFTVPADHIFYVDEPPQSSYYVDFVYQTTDITYLSYLRSNLNWKTSYQLNLFQDSKSSILIAMADIRNDGKSKVNIDKAELLGGDINLQMAEKRRAENSYVQEMISYDADDAPSRMTYSPPSIAQGKEVAGLYVFTIDKPFSIDAKTNYLLPMFRPQVTVERFGLIHKTYFHGAGKSTGKAQRTYRLSSDRFLSRGNCMIREDDHLVGETFLPDLAAKDNHTFSIGEDSDIVYKENITLVSSHTYNETIRPGNKVEQRTKSIYDVRILLKNYKKNRSMRIEFKQSIDGRSVKLVKSSGGITLDGSTVECKTTLAADEEKVLSYSFEQSK